MSCLSDENWKTLERAHIYSLPADLAWLNRAMDAVRLQEREDMARAEAEQLHRDLESAAPVQGDVREMIDWLDEQIVRLDGYHGVGDKNTANKYRRLLAILSAIRPNTRKMTGFMATLTDEQKAAALAYTGDDTLTAPPIPAEVEKLAKFVDGCGLPGFDEVAQTLRDLAVRNAFLERKEYEWRIWRDEMSAASQSTVTELDAAEEKIEMLRKALLAAEPYVVEQAADGYPPPMEVLAKIDAALKDITK